MKILYADESDYGQQILQILAELASLMEEEKLYTKTQIVSILSRIQNYAFNLKDIVRKIPAVDGFYNPYNSIDQWHAHIKALEDQAKEGSN